MDGDGLLLEIERLQKVGDGRLLLAIDRLGMNAGEILALVGPAGSGKTTLQRLILGREAPTAGTIRVLGRDPRGQRHSLGGLIGALFAADGLYDRRSAAGNLRFFTRMYGLPSSRAEEILALVGLRDQAQTRAGRLPSGLRRRLALGIALLPAPPLLLLQDPFARCDEASITLMGDLLRRHADGGGGVLILADGDAHMEALVDRLLPLEQGRLGDERRTREATPRGVPFKIPVRLEGSVALVNPGDILFASARDGRAVLQLAGEELTTHYSLSELEARLGRSGFFRAHRSYLVNLQHVREVIPYTRASYSLRLADEAGTEIPLSRDAARELRELLGY